MVTKSAPTPAFPDVGDVLGGRYELLRVIGEGGMGIIVAAKQLSMDREVAIKLLRPEVISDDIARRRFEREVHVAKELAHPHIVQLIDSGLDGDIAWVAMELLQGENLYDLIQREGPLPLGRALSIVEQVLDALTIAHRKSVVHRDLKPLNIFVTPSRREQDFVKVLDFGIARPLTDTSHYVTQTGLVTGTLPYMAPEVLADNEISPAADVYAAGLVLLEMLYGRAIFQADSPTKMALQHMRKQIPLPQSLRGSELGRVIMRATAKRKDERYVDADEFLAYLSDARRGVDEEVVLSSAEIDAAFEAVAQDVVGELMDSAPSIDEFVNAETMAAVLKPAPQGPSLRAAPGQMTTDDVEPTSRKSMFPALGAIVGLLLACGIVFMLASTSAEPEPETPQPAPPEPTPLAVAQPEPDAAVEPAAPDAAAPVDEATAPIRVESKPSSAAVHVNGSLRYETPVEIEVAEAQTWVLKLDGHRDKTVVVGPDTPYLMVELEPLPKPKTPRAKPQKQPDKPTTPQMVD